mgnify:CR=1 FL=1
MLGRFTRKVIAFVRKEDGPTAVEYAVMLALIIGTKLVWQPGWPIARYDFLTITAVIIQFLLLYLRLES